jgi:hypothetical protein
MSFWDIVWFIIISFAFVAYLMVIFSILGDLFRDRDTSGAVKAIWVVCLIFFPFVTALIYLVTRGRSMAERSAHAAVEQRRQQDEYIRDVAGKDSPSEQISKAHALLDQGVISQSEYDALKTKALV